MRATLFRQTSSRFGSWPKALHNLAGNSLQLSNTHGEIAMPVPSLTPDKLRRHCSPESFTFESTAELPASAKIIGQQRGTRAIEFGIGIKRQGYNVYVLGPIGTGRETAIERFLQEQTNHEPVPGDWVYVHNFSIPHQPRAILLPAGQGARLQQDMARLITDLRDELPQAFDTDTYRKAIETFRQAFEAQQATLLEGLHQKAAAEGFALLNTPSGFVVSPVTNGRPMSQEEWQQVPVEQRQTLSAQQTTLSNELEDILHQIRQLEAKTRQEMKQIDRDVAATCIQHRFEQLHDSYRGQEEVLLYLGEVHQDVLDQIDDFTPPLDSNEEIDLRRYEVNVLVDNSQTKGAPVILEKHPTYHNLFGRLEYEMRSGVVSTHFTNIKCGSLHHANGGYLIMNAHDVLRNPLAWEALKRALKGREINVQPAATLNNNQLLAKSLDPEPVILSIKIILMGSVSLYYTLYEQDEDFRVLFKVRSDFESTMPRTQEQLDEYAHFIATRCHEEGLRHFDLSAVTKAVEFGSRLADHQGKLSTLFGAIADLIREADYWAGKNGHDRVNAADLQMALDERTFRANSIEEQLHEQILENSLLIATEGSVIGQVNGLSVMDTGEYAFGQPGRITARTFMGEEGVVHIERETEMAGPLHNKGVLTLAGYLGGTYAQHQPLSLTASLTFEQNYGGIEGDSASSTELYALLSSLSKLPINQGIAVTGSVNQWGDIQPIGGVNQKIEGFFRICRARGLNGEQGVIIPESNVHNLMLHDDVIEAVAQGQFQIWSVRTVNEGIELLTGFPAGERDAKGSYPEGTVHSAVQARLRQLAEELQAFGDDED
jgi:predicted ATP-dependent protease